MEELGAYIFNYAANFSLAAGVLHAVASPSVSLHWPFRGYTVHLRVAKQIRTTQNTCNSPDT